MRKRASKSKMKNEFPRNKNLPEGISLLRQLNAKANPETLNLGLGKPEVDMPNAVRDLIQSALQEAKLDYTENAGDSATRELLAKKLNLSVGKSLVLVHGAQEGLMAALIAVMNAGDEILVPDPGFLSYPTMIKILGGKAIPYMLKKTAEGFKHDLGKLKAKITSRTRAIIISSPGNPTGCDFNREDANELIKIIGRKKIVILSDEVYGMLHFTQNYSPLAKLHPRIISINSFSKSHALTGWRIGFIASEDEKLKQACLIAHQYIATCASVPAQRLLGKLLKLPLFDQIPNDFRISYQKKLQLFRDESSPELQAKTPMACGGFYLFPELPIKMSSLEFCQKLLHSYNVLAIPGAAFGKMGEHHIRLSLAIPDGSVKEAAKILSQFY